MAAVRRVTCRLSHLHDMHNNDGRPNRLIDRSFSCTSSSSAHNFTCWVQLGASFPVSVTYDLSLLPCLHLISTRKRQKMAGLLPSYPNPTLLSLTHKKSLLTSPYPLSLFLHHSSRRSPWISRSPPPRSGKDRRIRVDRSPGRDEEEPSYLRDGFADDWGEKIEPEVESLSEADPPRDDDEWGKEVASSGSKEAMVITDEWGEKSDLEPEKPGIPDPLPDDDEWGNGIPISDGKLRELKRCLVDTFYGTELGFRASAEVRAEIVELVTQLEAKNPTPAPNKAQELLDGNWILLYTAFSELLPLLAVGSIPTLKIEKISQSIDIKNQTIINSTTLSSPLATFSFSSSASFEVQSPSRIQVLFKEGAFQLPEVPSTLDLPEKLEIFGQKIDLQPVKQSLNPIQEAIANITRGISSQLPLKVPIQGNRAKSWLLTTYLDQDFRISRGDGGLFVLAKDGSSLLDQLL